MRMKTKRQMRIHWASVLKKRKNWWGDATHPRYTLPQKITACLVSLFLSLMANFCFFPLHGFSNGLSVNNEVLAIRRPLTQEFDCEVED